MYIYELRDQVKYYSKYTAMINIIQIKKKKKNII